MYVEVAKKLNYQFRSVLHATANEYGISVVAKMDLDYHRLVASLECSAPVKSKRLTVTLFDSGIICIR
jgi:hypothetical protein